MWIIDRFGQFLTTTKFSAAKTRPPRKNSCARTKVINVRKDFSCYILRMSKSDRLSSEKKWKPRRVEWALQPKVVDAVILLLADPRANLDLLAQTIDGLQAVGQATIVVKASLQWLMRYAYKTTFELGGREQMIEDMRAQREWLKSQPEGIAPARMWRNQRSRQEFERQRELEKSRHVR